MDYNLITKYKFTHQSDIENLDYPNFDALKGKIFLETYGKGKRIEIGRIKLDLYNDSWCDFGYDIYKAFERASHSFRIGTTLLVPNNFGLIPEIEEKIGISCNQSILVVDEIMFYEEYRGKGYGKELLLNLEMYFRGRCGYIALQSFPKQFEIGLKDTEKFKNYGLSKMEHNDKKAQLSLNSFYERCGYTNVNEELNIFIKNIDPAD
jgi:GNAT superfamily N-acetyltransferase